MPGIYDHLLEDDNGMDANSYEDAVPSSRHNGSATTIRQDAAKVRNMRLYKESSGSENEEDNGTRTHDGDRSWSDAELSDAESDSDDVALDDGISLRSLECGEEEEEHEAEVLDDDTDVLTGGKSHARIYKENLAAEKDAGVVHNEEGGLTTASSRPNPMLRMEETTQP
ncbi:hypothetical protein ColLi_05681 [Colletotrichum liriopes]|uniref:Uncharacterized protein n=1 Tax=Colletotrichum liriopes TaxID=708192 RepID=A0AA37LSY6_9PEZI|nr:hypothetical protein ColLi_05681 [Colletotrichum liriopes]